MYTGTCREAALTHADARRPAQDSGAAGPAVAVGPGAAQQVDHSAWKPPARRLLASSEHDIVASLLQMAR